MAKMNIADLRRLSGLAPQAPQQLEESNPWAGRDDDDDEDRDAKIASSDKRQRSFEKKNKGELSAAQAEAKKKAAEAKAKSSEKKEEPKKEAPAAKAEEKKPEPKKEEPKAEEKKEESPAAEAKRRGKAPNENSFNQQAKKYAKEHGRASFIKWAAETHGKGKNYASTLFAKYNPKSSREIKEGSNDLWIITHPNLPGFTLAENEMMRQLQWVDASSPLDTMVFESEAEVNRVVKYINEWKGWVGNVEKVQLLDD